MKADVGGAKSSKTAFTRSESARDPGRLFRWRAGGPTQRGLVPVLLGEVPGAAAGDPGRGAVPPGPKFVTGKSGAVGNVAGGEELPEPLVELLPRVEPGVVTVPLPMAEPESPTAGPILMPLPMLVVPVPMPPEVVAVAPPAPLAAPAAPSPAARAIGLAAVSANTSAICCFEILCMLRLLIVFGRGPTSAQRLAEPLCLSGALKSCAPSWPMRRLPVSASVGGVGGIRQARKLRSAAVSSVVTPNDPPYDLNPPGASSRRSPQPRRSRVLRSAGAGRRCPVRPAGAGGDLRSDERTRPGNRNAT
jgi:hypothetical protein